MFKRRTIIITCIVILIAFIMTLVLPLMFSIVNAATVQDQINQTQQQKSDAQKKLDDAKNKEKDALAQKAEIDKDISAVEDNIESINEKIKVSDEAIKVQQKAVDALKVEFDKNSKAYKARVTAMYQDGLSSYIGILFTSESFSDFLTNYEAVQSIIKHDTDIIDVITKNQKATNAAMQEIQEQKKQQQNLKAVQVARKNDLSQKAKDRDDFVAKLVADEAAYKKAIDKADQHQQDLLKQLQPKISVQSSGPFMYSGGKLAWPLDAYFNISSQFGMRAHPVTGAWNGHSGIDIPAPSGTPIKAASDGTVIFAGWDGAYGNCVIVSSGGGLSELYGHQSRLGVKNGQSVKKGDVIGYVGTTGLSTGNHLHFQVMENGTPVNPIKYLR